MVHELIAAYYTGGDTRDLKEHNDEVKPLLIIILKFTGFMSKLYLTN